VKGSLTRSGGSPRQLLHCETGYSASVRYWDTDIRHLGQSMNTRAVGSPQHLW